MTKTRVAAALLAAAAAVAPLAPAAAQPCYYTREYFPLVFPFGVAAAIVETAAAIATLPLAAVGVPPYAPVYPLYGSPCSVPYYGYPPPPVAPSPYTGYGYYGPPR